MPNNAVSIVRGDMERHRVSVTLPGEATQRKSYLLMVGAKTSLLKDIEVTYGQTATCQFMRFLKKIYGEAETDNVYGVFLDDDLKIVFAFNRLFADYDSKSHTVVYKAIDKLIEESIPGPSEFPSNPSPCLPGLPIPDDWLEVRPGGMLIRYSILDPHLKDDGAD